MIFISACLLGKKCRYNAEHNLNRGIVAMAENEENISLCPELLGGLSVPRVACEIVGGTGKEVLEGRAQVLTREGEDHTAAFISGAQKVLQRCKEQGVKLAYLKSKSPSCGYGQTYSGSFTKELHTGNGVLAELLSQNGIEVRTTDSDET
jgi:uncharacterized protein YbbK (DUF523 family)